MEYFLARAMEIGRLSLDQISELHKHETTDRVRMRCLMPYEIQEMFDLTPLKEHFTIPVDDLNAQVGHASRLRAEIRNTNFGPKYEFSPTDIQGIHEFDEKLLTALELGEMRMSFTGGKRQRRMTDEIGG